MTYSSDHIRETKRMNQFRQRMKMVCYLTIVLYCSALFFAIHDYLAEMEGLAYQGEQTVIFCPQHTTTPQIEVIDVSSGTIREASAYNSVIAQTDDTPCIGADGSNLCDRLAAGECLFAANFDKLGTKHYLEGFGECTLADRMNSRYKNSIDIFMGDDISAANQFGRRSILVKDLN